MATRESKTEFPKALKSFMGHLEGTGKALHTIKNYRLDLLSFADFLSRERPKYVLREIPQKDLERFQEHLKKQGLKTNTRRRKVLTVAKFLRYLAGRKKVDVSLARRMPAPQRVERVPFTLPYEQLRTAILALPRESVLDRRNRLLLWTMLETGGLVSEAARLRYDQIQGEKKPIIRWGHREPRDVSVSEELARELREFQRRKGAGEWVFNGHTRGGPLVGPISPRGVELLVRTFEKSVDAQPGLTAGFAPGFTMTPRTFRHTRVVEWLKQGVPREEVQRRLGLKTAYAFRTLEPILASFTASAAAAAASDPAAEPHPALK